MTKTDPAADPAIAEPEAPPSPDVVRTLVENHRQFLRFLERRVGDRATAEDLLQEALLRGLDRAGALRNEESIVAWFYRVLRNAIIDHHRRRAAAGRLSEALAAEGESPVDEETNTAVCQCVRDLAATLKPEYASAITRVELDGLSVQDLAREAGITAGNAAVRLFRAREALRKRLIAACGTCVEHGCFDCQCKTPDHAAGAGPSAGRP